MSLEVAWTIHIREVVNSWVALGRDVTLFAPKIWQFTTPPKCRVVYVPTLNIRFVREYLYLLLLPFYLLYHGIRSRPGAIYCREMSLMVFPFLCTLTFNIPLIMEINGFVIEEHRQRGTSRLKISIFRLMQSINLKFPHALVMVSQEIVELFRGEYNLSKKKIFFVPNGVDTDRFSPGNRDDAIKILGLNPEMRYVTFIGSFYHYALTPFIVASAGLALDRFSDVHFLMVGDGDKRRECERIARDSGISSKITFTGIRPNEEIPVIIRASSILINIREFYRDGSIKILEYMASGGAMISNLKTVYSTALTHNVDYFLLPELTAEALSDAIITLITDEDLRVKIGKRARELILENFSWEKTAMRLLEVIDEVGGYPNTRRKKGKQ